MQVISGGPEHTIEAIFLCKTFSGGPEIQILSSNRVVLVTGVQTGAISFQHFNCRILLENVSLDQNTPNLKVLQHKDLLVDEPK